MNDKEKKKYRILCINSEAKKSKVYEANSVEEGLRLFNAEFNIKDSKGSIIINGGVDHPFNNDRL